MAVRFLEQRLDRVVGDKTAKALREAFDLHSVEDLLRHYPRRYADRGHLTDLSKLRLDEHATVLARVESIVNHDYRQRAAQPRRNPPLHQRTEVIVTDGTGRLMLTFFRQPYLVKRLPAGTVGLFAGKVTEFRGRRQLTHPDYAVFDGDPDDVDSVEQFVAHLIPIYPATAKIASWRIAKSIALALDSMGDVDDPLPEAVRQEFGLLGLRAALEKVHRPESAADWHAAHKRLRFEEAYVLQVVLAQRRAVARSLPATPRTGRPGGLLDRFDTQLPFGLTTGQRLVGAEISRELGGEHPMHRLLQGEVGSGKTVVALRAMLQVVDSGGQAVLLAPTEVLAQQHHRTICGLLGPMAAGGMLGGADDATRVALLTGSLTAAARREALLDTASGAAGIVVGTHALLEERVQFADLGLVVVDEQHRFGVEQRAALTAKTAGTPPHVLVMTATPIPRTVAMTVFGDLDVSTLRELPPGRAPIQTNVVPAGERPSWLDRTWQRLREEAAKGHQAYVVCPRIGDEPDTPGEPAEDGLPTRRSMAVADVAAMLTDEPLRGLTIGELHGRLGPQRKDAVMSRFAAGDIDVLVSTTVIEVGVDVPNASVMVVMDAERFGVSQLHQLRGRVGRGVVPGLCLLVTEAAAGSPSRQRLGAIAATTDGFELSAIDLRHRREGDILGVAQSGRQSRLRLLSVIDHEAVIAQARDAATRQVAADPALEGEPELARAVAVLNASERAGYLDKA